MSLSVHIDNKNKDILILGKGLTQGLDDTTLTAEAKYPINFTQSEEYLTVCSCHVTYAFESESTLYSCLNVKELQARSHNHLVHKRTLIC